MAAKKNASAAVAGHDEFTGFVNDTADRSASWFAVKKDAVVIGDLLGAFDMPDQFNQGKRRDYVQVKLLAPTLVSTNEDGEKGTREADKGEIVSIGITSGLQVILEKHVPVVEAGGQVHLRVTVTGARQKAKTSGNQFWPFKVESKVVRPAVRQIIPRAARAVVANMPNGVPAKSGDEMADGAF